MIFGKIVEKIQNDIRKTIDSINDIFCELSIWDEKIVIRSIANDNYDLKKTLNYILKSIIHDKLPKNWNLKMKLTPREKDKLMVSMAAIVARKRLDRGIKLNYPEAIALITDFVIEGARDGKMVSELMESGANVVKKENCMDGVADMISEVQVEATFPDGTKLVTVHKPIR